MCVVAEQREDGVVIRVVTADDLELVQGAVVFDRPADPDLTLDFLGRSGHHLVFALDSHEVVGFVTGIEIAHPDKAPQMLLYELGVEPSHRRRGIGRALVRHLADLAADVGCRQMWVPIEAGDDTAAATYRSAGARDMEASAILTWHLRPNRGG